MRHSKCVVCGFNVLATDARCQNCGLLHPLESLMIPQRDYSNFVTVAVVAAVLAPIFGFAFAFGPNATFCFALPVCIVSVFLVRATATAIAIKWSNRSQHAAERLISSRTTPNQESLSYKEDVIRRRMLELSGRERQVNAVLARVQQSTEEKWQQVRATLEASRQTLQRQHARYSAKAIEIDLVRVQNKLAPFVYDTDKYSFLQINAYLTTIEEAQQSAAKLGAQLAEQRRILGSVREIEDLAQRLSAVQSSTRQLHDALVGRQAVLALKEITPLTEALTPVSTPVAGLRASEVFNIQVAITDFSASFDELESEYLRVQTEEDLAQQVGEITRRQEPE